jgi:hypothetical protein
MTRTEIDNLFERLARHAKATKRNAGEGSAWQCRLSNGETHTYAMVGVRTHAEAMDSAENLIKWIWDSKDYLKKRAESLGKNGEDIEKFVNHCKYLSVCADLANGLKHGGLDKNRKSRSKSRPRFGAISFTVPQAAVGSLVFGDYNVAINVSHPDMVEVKLPILAESGELIGDAFDFAYQAIQALEDLRNQVQAAV